MPASRSPQDMPECLADFRVDALRVCVFNNREQAGRAAGRFVAEVMAPCIDLRGSVNAVFAAAPSQNEFLAALVAEDLRWPSVNAFHMDEYLGLSAGHPSSFRHYLHHHLFRRVGLHHDQLHLILGEKVDDPLGVCQPYDALLQSHPTDLVCAGIGENGHLAFNDPPVADFDDPVRIKTVRLDQACRAQQVADGCFATLDDVPTHAFTLTIPALMAASTLSVVVPGPRKAEAVRLALHGAISESCPASILRTHAGATLWLDRESASGVWREG